LAAPASAQRRRISDHGRHGPSSGLAAAAPLLDVPDVVRALGLATPEIGIKPVRSHEAGVVAAFDDPAAIEHQDLVRGKDAGQSVRDHDGRGALGDGGEIGLDRLLGGAVERRGRFVEDEDARALQDRAGDRQTLLLAAGQLEATLADQGRVPLGQGVDEALERSGCRRGVDSSGRASGRASAMFSPMVSLNRTAS
jgi:hypothetical protein